MSKQRPVPATVHTPGPWKFTTTAHPRSGGIVVGKDGMQVCVFPPNDRMGTEEWLANAWLILAAPNLLAACQAALSYIGADVLTEEDEGREGPALALNDLLAAAIAATRPS